MKGFTSFKILIFLSNFLFSNQIQFVPFDWGYQFGYSKNKGMIIWGEDWRSKNLLFDGTWSIFVPMYGESIMQDFLKGNQQKIILDSSQVISNITYDQGDYGLDNFSFSINYFEKNRQIDLEGFKRSYFGSRNQYYLNTSQPQQQSYTFSYKSKINNGQTGLSIGHFNTLAGFPDTVTNGIFDNRITSLNYFYQKRLGSSSFELFMDHFLQRYKAVHSLSFYNKSRYLNRSIYKAQIVSSINKIPVLFGLSRNDRNIFLDSNVNNEWYDFYSILQWHALKLSSIITQYKDQLFFDYSIIFEKKFKAFEISALNKTLSLPIHPYYQHKLQDFQNNNFSQKVVNHVSIEWSGLKNQISLAISFAKDNQKLEQLSSSLQNQYSNMKLNYSRNVFSNLDVLLSYNTTGTENYYSGGIGNEIGLGFQSQYLLFENFMKIEVGSDIKYYSKRVNYSMINPIEMVPLIIEENKGELPPVTLINGNVRVTVSSVIFKFTWINISEIFLSSIGSNENNFFRFHPIMPTMGQQINFSIHWAFQD